MRLSGCPARSTIWTSDDHHPCRTQLTEGSVGFLGAGEGTGEPGRCWQAHHEPPRQSSWWRSRQAAQITPPLSPIVADALATRGRMWPPFRVTFDELPGGESVECD